MVLGAARIMPNADEIVAAQMPSNTRDGLRAMLIRILLFESSSCGDALKHRYTPRPT